MLNESKVDLLHKNRGLEKSNPLSGENSILTVFKQVKDDQQFTQKLIDAAQPKEREYTLWDPLYPGFGLRIRPSGRKSFVLLYRFNRQQRRKTFGKASTLTLKEARDRVREFLRDIDDGIDPTATKTSSRKQTVSEVYELYQREKLILLSQGHRVRVNGIFEKRILPAIGRKAIGTVSRADVRRIVSELNMERKPAMANNVFRAISASLSWCYFEEIIADPNPLLKLPLPNNCASRDRVLSPYEMAFIWKKSFEMEPKWEAGIQLLMLTGLRRGEVFDARLSEICLRSRTWTIPADRTKNRHGHRVFLSDSAMRVLHGLEVRHDQTYLFESESTFHPRPITGNTRKFQSLQKLVEGTVRNWRIHDIRRSVATHMAEIGVEPYVIEFVLNHRGGYRSGVTAIYNRYGYGREVIAAWKLWGQTLESWVQNIDALEPEPEVEL